MVSHRENEIPASQWRRQRNNIAVVGSGEGGQDALMRGARQKVHLTQAKARLLQG